MDVCENALRDGAGDAGVEMMRMKKFKFGRVIGAFRPSIAVMGGAVLLGLTLVASGCAGSVRISFSSDLWSSRRFVGTT